KDTRSPATEAGPGPQPPRDRAVAGYGRGHGERVRRARPHRRHRLGGGGDARRRYARGQAVPLRRRDVAPAARPGLRGQRAAAARRDAEAGPRGVPRPTRGRLRLHPVLRDVPRVVPATPYHHAPGPPRGDKLFVDYAGKKPTLVDPKTGERIEVELFVAVL